MASWLQHDRKKDMILVSGFNVYPNEVEAVLAAHPQIVEAAVVGVGDPRSGEAVAATIVRRDAALSEAAVFEHCRQGLAAYKCPKLIEFADELPKSVVGKILRRAAQTGPCVGDMAGPARRSRLSPNSTFVSRPRAQSPDSQDN